MWKAQLEDNMENIPANKLQALCKSDYESVVRAKRQNLCYYMSRTAKSHGAIVPLHATLLVHPADKQAQHWTLASPAQ